jgi:hypothetical protein
MKRETHREYQDKLKDWRWKSFCTFVYAQEKFRGRTYAGPWCEVCESLDNLQVHHLGYREHIEPWDYRMDEVMVLCDVCHQQIHLNADELWNEVLKCRNTWHIYEVLKAARNRLADLLFTEKEADA